LCPLLARLTANTNRDEAVGNGESRDALARQYVLIC
jgi:hypothetical protein